VIPEGVPEQRKAPSSMALTFFSTGHELRNSEFPVRNSKFI
jgi:hypothetical protein